jgi:hypothetical protein
VPLSGADDAGEFARGSVGELGIGQRGNLEVEIPPGDELEAQERPRSRRPGR